MYSLNLLNKLRKRDKMRSLLRILSLFRNKLNQSNYTGARMLDSVYNMTFKLFLIHIFWSKTYEFHHVAKLKASFNNVSQKSINH